MRSSVKLSQDFMDFIQLLNEKQVEYLVVGGYAVVYYGYVRPIGDLDVWVNPSKENAKKMVDVLRSFGFGSLNIGQQDFEKKDAIIQFGYEPNRITIVTTREGLVFKQCYQKKEEYQLSRGPLISFIDLESLKKYKQLSDRSKDRNDLKQLEKITAEQESLEE